DLPGRVAGRAPGQEGRCCGNDEIRPHPRGPGCLSGRTRRRPSAAPVLQGSGPRGGRDGLPPACWASLRGGSAQGRRRALCRPRSSAPPVSPVLDTTVLIDLLRGDPGAQDYLLSLEEVPTCS